MNEGLGNEVAGSPYTRISTTRMGCRMGRADWLLLLLDGEALGAGGSRTIDPVRVQKGMFLLSKIGPARDLYDFSPYHWGPFSRDVYRDLDALEAEGLVRSEPVPGQSWAKYSVTAAGSDRAREFGRTLDPEQIEWLSKLRRFLTTRSFNKLLRDVYDQFPEFATRSRFQG